MDMIYHIGISAILGAALTFLIVHIIRAWLYANEVEPYHQDDDSEYYRLISRKKNSRKLWWKRFLLELTK